jgi:hypothetical protein
MAASSSPSLSETARRIAIRLARPDILFWTLPLMMILLVAGTVAQKDTGLYAAHHTYFASFIAWFGFIPFPGGYTLMIVFFVNLLAKFLLFSEWELRKAGIILSHLGVLLLVLGGLFTALTEREGYVVIPEGQTVSISEDYHQRTLKILKDGAKIFSLPHQSLKDGLKISDPALPWSITIDRYCYNCAISRRSETQQAGWSEPGKFMQLSPAPPETEDEMNLTGVEFTVDSMKYLTFDKFPKPPEIKAGDHTYTIIMGRKERPLPFSLTLKKFSRDVHPGSDLPKSFRSDIIVTDGAASWPAVITMNEPLRYRGYTFYQSSFDDSGETPFTVLSVVENRGRFFPYIASIIMALGLILHLIIRLRGAKEAP